MTDETPQKDASKDEPTVEETRRALRLMFSLVFDLVPPAARPYIFGGVVAAVVSTGLNVYDFLGVASVHALSAQEAKIDALINAFEVAHPDVPVEVVTAQD